MLAAILAALLGVALSNRSDQIAAIYFFKQDLPVLCVMFGAAALMRDSTLARWQSPIAPSTTAFAIAAMALAAMVLIGSRIVMLGFDMSRDEALASFAAVEIGKGALVTPAPPEWRAYTTAMMPRFMHGVTTDELWAAGYLPVNAALRALAAKLAHPALANPLLLILGWAALASVARRLWPTRPDAVVVTLLMAMTSSQLLVAGMTSYAMTGHFALNMVWLALFLRGTKGAHCAAVAVGFLATGLHQAHFHPLFVAPFILWLLAKREWRLLSFYTTAYVFILLVWLKGYPELLLWLAHGSSAVTSLDGEIGSSMIGRLKRLFETSPALWIVNLLRFIAWQNILLVPLALCALLLARRRVDQIRSEILYPLLFACATGLCLMMFQGHGWGYRYLHGLIGCVCLLAGYGWLKLLPEPGVGRPWAIMKVATAMTMLVILPIQLAMAHAFVAPHARLYRAIKAADADAVLIDQRGGFYAEDLIQNSADPGDLPKIMSLGKLSEPALRKLCREHTVLLIDRRHFQAFGLRMVNQPHLDERDISVRRAFIAQMQCDRPLPLRH